MEKNGLVGLVGRLGLVAALLAASIGRNQAAALPDPITEWSRAASSVADQAGMAPLRTPITFAILHVGMYDAVTAITGDGQPYTVSPPVTRPASPYGAAVEAGYQVLLAEFPSQRSALDAQRSQLLGGIPDSVEKTNGINVGAEVARQLLARRANDERNAVVPYVAGAGPGAWVPTPPAYLGVTTAFLARVTPFTMDSPSQFRPAGPPALGSNQWLREHHEVKALGAKDGSPRTAAQTATAWFWEPLAGTVWPATIRRVAAEQRLDLASSARFQAAAFAAFADSLIACWDAKFFFNTWRPVTAIRADTGNNRAASDLGWEPLAVTPNFPEYPSGHTCVTAAVAHTIEDFFAHPVSIPARNINSGEERVYRTAHDVVDEVIEARMLLGVHFRSADADGAEMGRKIARQIRSRWFKKNGS